MNQGEDIQQLLLDNKTIEALTEGVERDIAILQKESTPESKSKVVQLTVQLNVLKDKKSRNLAKINALVEKNKDSQ